MTQTLVLLLVLAFDVGVGGDRREVRQTGSELRRRRETNSQKVRVRVRHYMDPWQTHFGRDIKCLIHQMF